MKFSALDISMDYIRGPDARFRAPSFSGCVKSASSRPNRMLSLNNYGFDDLTFHVKKGLDPGTKLFQAPPFVVGGFVGSKSCEQKSICISFNFKDMFESLMDTVIPNVKSSNHTQTKLFGEKYCQKQTVTIPNSCAKTKTSPSKSEYLPPNVVISSPAVTQAVSVSSPTMPNQQENQLSPAPCRTVSESSESSWASVSPEANQDVLLSNPWLRNIVVCVGDSDDSDESDSDWDCVEDFQSENGEVISDFKWNGDSLSPISSPVSQTPPVPAAALDDYDSDESDGVLISCGSGYVFDDEEEARERKLSEERIQDANRRWDRNLSTAVDETDGIRKTSRSKQVLGRCRLICCSSIKFFIRL